MVRAFVYLAHIQGFASAWQHSRAGCQRGRVVLKAEEKPWVPPTPADWQEDAAALGSTPSWLASAAAPPAKAVEAVAAPTAEAWRQTCDSDGVVSYYDFGLRLSAAAPAAAPAPAAPAPPTIEEVAAFAAAAATEDGPAPGDPAYEAPRLEVAPAAPARANMQMALECATPSVLTLCHRLGADACASCLQAAAWRGAGDWRQALGPDGHL